MRWTRRAFLEASGAAAAVLSLGTLGFKHISGRVFFDEDRALPGMRLALTLDIDEPETKRVSIIARCEGTERIMETRTGSNQLEIEVPAIETDDESFELYALVESGLERYLSDPVEVLSQPYHFGL